MQVAYLCPEPTSALGRRTTARCLRPVHVDECGTVPSTSGPVVLVRARCPAGHVLCGPREMLELVAVSDEAA